MPIRQSATPLIGIEAVAFDLETTGLNTREDRIVQIGAVAVSGGSVDDAGAFQTYVDPGRPIPPASTAVHAITDDMVAGAPTAGDALGELEAFVADRPVIGHSVGFDLAVWKAEAERGRRPFDRPRSLDTRLLAEVALPGLPDYSIEMVTSRLGIEPEGRHDALGDAVTTARMFFALVPHLRERGIRTIAEAESACGNLREAAETHVAAGWEEPVANRGRGNEAPLARIDSYPYRHRVREVMTSPPLFAQADDTVFAAARQMESNRVSSLFVDDPRQATGIVTERDLLRAIAARGAGALHSPIDPITSRPLATVPADAFIYRAIGRMDRLAVRHLGVTDEAGQLIGALSARDLLRLRASQAIRLGDAIEVSETVGDLAAAWAELPEVAETLIAEEVDPRTIAAVISRELSAATRRAGDFAEARLRREGLEPPDQEWALLVLGSGGRGESLLAMDQDNAIVFADGEPEGDADRYFARFGEIVADILHEIGVPYCKGGVMARNPEWRGSVATWRKRVETWVARPTPENLLAVDIFFDLRAVRGATPLADQMFADAYALASTSAPFAKQLVASSVRARNPLGLFGRFLTDKDGRIDLKACGLFPIVALARTLCIRHNIPVRATRDRYEALREKGIGAKDELARLEESHRAVMGFVLAQQIRDLDAGRQPGNSVEIKALSRGEQRRLREALSPVEFVDHLARDLLF